MDALPRLRPFQREDVDFLKENGLRALVASAPGTGKTPVTVRALAETYRASLPAVVVCPASVVRHWVREVKRWAPGVTPILIEDMASPIPYRTRAAIYVISWSLLDARWPDFRRIGLRTVVADEAHYGKNPGALRSQALYQLASSVRYILLLTGTPVINTHRELQVLHEVLGSEDPPMIRRLLEDVAPDIPPKNRSYLYVQLREKQRKRYDKANEQFEDWLRVEKEKMLGEGMAEAEVERALAAEALAKVGYLRRLVGEFKVPAASDWIAQAVRLGEPVVVFCEHQNVIVRLSKALKKQRIRHGILDGSTSTKKRQSLIDGFQNYKFPVFIGSKAAKEGITLTAARHLLFVERFWTSAEEEQAEDRIRRIGQKHRTTIWFLHAPDTVDDRVDSIVRSKRRVVRDAIGAADIMETPTGNVEALLRSWGEHVAPDVQVTTLGLGNPLPPLPPPKSVHAVVFYGSRWKPLSAFHWCRMNGYRPTKLKKLYNRFKMVVHPAVVFRPNQFTVYRVSKDIRILVGGRLSQSNERRVRAALKRAT